MIDFHTHTFLSDGVLCPAELVQRAKEKGYTAVGITDHVDLTTLEWVAPRILNFCREINSVETKIQVIAGVELTHLPPSLIGSYIETARKLGSMLVIVHGESIVEPVPPGTNLAAIEANVDILAHPGLLKDEEAKLASERGVYLELSTRKGHCLTNGRVASLARKYNANLLINTDAHQPEDLVTNSQAEKILWGAGLNAEEVEHVFRNAKKLKERILQ